jgi:alpha-amylase
MSANGVILQSFQWHTPTGTLYQHLIDHAPSYAGRGYTAVWFPPPGKGHGGQFGAAHDVGYGAYDLFDLGEFDQKGSIPTKYGTRQQLLDAVKAVQHAGMQAYLDVVFDHKDSGAEQIVLAQEVDARDRNCPVAPWRPIKAFTKFDFAPRGGKYSTMAWRWYHFDAVAWDGFNQQSGKVYRLKDKTFETEVSPEHGNYDFLMACDLDTDHRRSTASSAGGAGGSSTRPARTDSASTPSSTFAPGSSATGSTTCASTSAGANCSRSASTGRRTTCSGCTTTSRPRKA